MRYLPAQPENLLLEVFVLDQKGTTRNATVICVSLLSFSQVHDALYVQVYDTHHTSLRSANA